MMKKRGFNKKAQVTLFIIIAIILIAALLLVYFFVPGVRVKKEMNPNIYLDKCVQDSVSESLERIGEQGGVLFPQNYILFQDKQVEYLCYNSEYYRLCKIQKPFPEKTVESEIKKYSETRIKKCLAEMERDFRKKGYEVEQNLEDVSVDIVPNNIIVKLKAPITIKKDSTLRFDSFKINVRSQYFRILNVAENILKMESTYGDSEIAKYLMLYPDIKLEKKKQGDGTTIYIINHRKTEEKFVFASRSLVFPPGYGISV